MFRALSVATFVATAASALLPISRAYAQANCTACTWNIPSKIEENVRPAACEDMYQAFCIDNRGIKKNERELADLNESLQRAVKEAKQLGITSLGFPDINTAIKMIAVQRGVEFVPVLSEKAQKWVFEGDYSSFVDETQIFKSSNECRAKLQAVPKANKNDANSLRAANAAYEVLLKETAKMRLKGFHLSLPSAMATLTKNCETLSQLSAEGQAAPEYGKLKSVCAELPKVRKKAIDLFRKDNGTDLQKNQNAFVDEYADALTTFVAEPLKLNADADELTRLNAQRLSLNKQAQLACSSLNSGMTTVVAQTRELLTNLVSRSRPTVEALVNRFYTNSRKTKMESIVTRVKAEANDIVARLTTDPNLRKKVSEGYSRLKIGWINMPPPSHFVKIEGTPIEIINPEKELEFGFGVEAFFDPKLKFFTEINAYYKPTVAVGAAIKEDAQVAIMPAFIEYLDKNEFAFTNVFAHEAGHLMGPMLSMVNGHDLREAQKPVLECLAQPDSIRMNGGQGDEAFADTVAAEIIAKLVTELPEGNRLSALSAANEAFCVLDATDSFSISTEHGHPNTMLRIGGIFGGNSAFRKAMGCQAPSSTYRTCGIPERK